MPTPQTFRGYPLPEWSVICLSEGLIGEVVDIVTRAAVAAILSGEERISSSTDIALGYVPLSRRRNSALRQAMT